MALHSHPVWVDARQLRGGDSLKKTIKKAMKASGHLLFIVSPHTNNSAWVRKEIKYTIKQQRKWDDGFRIIPLILPGVELEALKAWFDDESLVIRGENKPNGLDDALLQLLASPGSSAAEFPQPQPKRCG